MSDTNDFEARLKRVEDELAIKDLVARYNFAIDDRTYDVLNDVFSSDAKLGNPPFAIGREAVRDALATRMDVYGPTMHVFHVHTLDWNSDGTVTGVLSGHAEHDIDGMNFLVAFRYYDTYKVEDGKWRISNRYIKTFYAVDTKDEYPNAFRMELRKRWPGTEPQRTEL